ncbi:glycosyltransferase family 9 protein [Candidatus Avelusimicrobium stercoris]|uniref:glycosyltransferase family 9 protein n=1 Tax=Candidatus Avelusimicrobium stercoris TaxID=1947924 RepID=UPI003D125C33
MNFDEPHIKISLLDLKQALGLRGRDSRLVRWAMKWSRAKKNFLSKLRHGGRTVQPGEKLRVLFWLAGGLGDGACARRLVLAYREQMPEAQFFIYAQLPDVAKTLFGGEDNTTILAEEKIHWADYDLVVQVCLTAKFLHADAARIGRLAPTFLPAFERAQEAQNNLGELLDDPFLTEAALGRWLYAWGGRRFDLLSYTGGLALPHDETRRLKTEPKILEKYGLSGVSYITFHDGTSSAQTVGDKRPTRAWPAVRWCEFFRLFKRQFPQIKLVQLGGKNSPVYEEADFNLVGKTPLSDLPSLLQGAKAHIDTESGLVQLAQYLDVRSVVIFGPTDQEFFGYAKNINLAAGPCGGCMWSTADWVFACPLGHKVAPCTEAVRAQDALKALKKILAH